MSDYVQVFVFGNALEGRDKVDFQRVPAWLLAEEIMTRRTTDNVLGPALGHLPGPRAGSILVSDNDYWRGLQTNGVELEQGRVIEAYASVDQTKCPNCGHVFHDTDERFTHVLDSLEPFSEGKDGKVTCAECGKVSDICDWDFNGGLAAGYYATKFWNWPELMPGLATKLSEMTGAKCALVRGKL